MDPPTITLVGTEVKISWSDVTIVTNGADVSSFTVLMLDRATDTYIEDKDVCDGTVQSVIDNKECLIEMADIKTELTLTNGELIQAKIYTTNEKGDSLVSDPSEGLPAQSGPIIAP